MSGEIGWQGRADKGEAHLRLTADEDALVQEAWRKAEAVRPAFDAMMREIRDRTNEQGSRLPGDNLSEGVVEIDYSLKTLESLRGKVARELADNPTGQTAAEVLADMKDLNRYTLLFDSQSYTQGTQSAFQELRSRGFDEIKVQNTWTDPVYKGINSAWEHPETGQRIELQLHTPDSFDVKMANHKLFELARSGALIEEFGVEDAPPYINAANQLMNDRYQTCREVNGAKLPIEMPVNHEQLAKPFARVALATNVEEKHLAAVRERAGEPAPVVTQNQATQQNMSVAQLSELKGGVKASSAGLPRQGGQGGQVVNPAAGLARQRSARGNAQSTGSTPTQGPAAQNAARPRQLPQQNNNNGRGRGH